jgi:hypothetical protein
MYEEEKEIGFFMKQQTNNYLIDMCVPKYYDTIIFNYKS